MSKRQPGQAKEIAATSESSPLPTSEILVRVSQRFTPVWPLKNYVAVNPYLGFSDLEWMNAHQHLGAHAGRTLYMLIEHYAMLWNERRLSISHLEEALDEVLRDGVPGAAQWTCEMIENVLVSAASQPEQQPANGPFSLRTIAQQVDLAHSSDWERQIRDEIGKHCARHYDQGQSTWSYPWSQLSLYEAWRKAQAFDRRMELSGLSGFRKFVQNLPHSTVNALSHLIDMLQVPTDLREPVLLSQAFDVSGWAAWTKYQVLEAERRGEACDDFLGLLAMRLSYDAYLSQHTDWLPDWKAVATSLSHFRTSDPNGNHSLALRHCLLRASEIAQRQRILEQLTPQGYSSARSTLSTPVGSHVLARMVFCMDVRSERIRRALEACSPSIHSAGYAGFFGIPMELVPWGERQAIPHAPAPVAPQIRVEEACEKLTAATNEPRLQRKATIRLRRKAWKSFQGSACSGLGHVESAGLWYGWQLLRSAIGLPPRITDERHDGLSVSQQEHYGPRVETSDGRLLDERLQIQLASNLVRSLGLQETSGRFIVFCGHASTSRNNPLQAALDCGACCGHSGEANARYAARLLNHPSIRTALAQLGLEIPNDVHFLAAVHNTTTDALTFFDMSAIPQTHRADFQELQRYTEFATQSALNERQPTLACPSRQQLLQRAHDWSEIRPEWGLAGNVAMVIGPRSLTQHAHLDGRVFLHDYDASRDQENAILEAIMTAPMVVAHWINMQYYASTVDNGHYGSGSKTIHNVTGQFGMLAGGGGDLLTGLPLQSVQRGSELQHEPLRLQVVISAPCERIHQIVQKHQLLRELVTNDWLHVVAQEEGHFFRYTRRAAWLPLQVKPRQL